MFLKIKGKSLYFILGIYLFIIISIAVVLQASYNYINIKKQLENNVINGVETSSLQLKGSLVSFIESYQVTEYEDLMKNEMKHKNILAIVLEDYLTGKIINKESYTTVIIKNKDLTLDSFIIEDISTFKQLENPFYLQKTILKNKNDEEIGRLLVYATSYYIEKDLKSVLISNLFSIIVIYLLLFFIIYILIKKVLINPINDIVNSLSNGKDDKLEEHSSKEFAYLTSSINEMTNQLKDYNKKLKESQFRWEFAVEGNGDGLWDWSLKTNEVFFSKKWKEMLGFEENEIKGSLEEWENRVHPEDLNEVYNQIQSHLDGKTKIYSSEHRVKCKDGSYKWILDRGVIVERDDSGKALRLIGIHTDIDDRKEYEKLMKEALTVYENTHEGIMVTDSKNNIITVNPSFCRTTGYSVDEVIGKKPSILKSSIYDEEFYKNLWEKLSKDGYWQGEITNKNKNGQLYDEYLSINTIKNKYGEIESFIGIFSDISTLKQQEKMILQQARTSAIGEMIGNIAHQWRQPLSAISTASTGMKLQLDMGIEISKEDTIEILEKINEQTQHLSNTIEDFRGFFKDDLSEIVEFDLSKTIDKVDNLIKDSFSHNFVKVNYDIEENLLIKGNKNLLLQALINIFNNALDVLKDKKYDRLLFVSAKKDDEKILIKIKDNGGGVEEQFIEKIFDPYFTTKHQSQGTGIGLYMTHQIITKQLNGNVYVKNKEFVYEGNKFKGAEFIISL